MIKHLYFSYEKDVDLIVKEFANNANVTITDYNIIPVDSRFAFCKINYKDNNSTL